MSTESGAVVVHRSGEVLDMEMVGEVDLRLSLAVTDALGNCTRDVLLDLSKVTFIDSTGVRLLLQIRSLVHSGDRTLTVSAVSPTVFRLLEICGLVDLFDAPHPEMVS